MISEIAMVKMPSIECDSEIQNHIHKLGIVFLVTLFSPIFISVVYALSPMNALKFFEKRMSRPCHVSV